MEGLYHQQSKTILQMVVQLKETSLILRECMHRNSHATSCIDAHTKNKMNNDRADGHCYIALPGFYDLKHSVTSIFPLMDHFLYRFSILPLFSLICDFRHVITHVIDRSDQNPPITAASMT